MIGFRFTMEDHLIINGSWNFIGLFDGHAGRTAADYCGKNYPNILKQKLKILEEKKDTNVLQIMKEAFMTVNDDFRIWLKTAKIPIKHVGTTAISILIKDNILYAANIGDSRAVLVRNGSAIRFTEDHKPCNDDEEERIRSLGGWVTRDEVSRVNGSLAVSRSIGDFYMHPLVSTEPFLQSSELTPEDEYLIIACDGLWDVFSDQEAAIIAIKSADVKTAAIKLRDLAYLRGSDDNISVVVIDLKNPPTNEELKVN